MDILYILFIIFCAYIAFFVAWLIILFIWEEIIAPALMLTIFFFPIILIIISISLSLSNVLNRLLGNILVSFTIIFCFIWYKYFEKIVFIQKVIDWLEKSRNVRHKVGY